MATVRTVAAVGLGLFAVHGLSYLPFLTDDALISLRYARRLLEGRGLTWTDGAPVEGYSNLLWVLASAALGALGLDLVLAVRLLGFAGGAAVIAAVLRAHRSDGGGAGLGAWAGVLGVALAGPLAAWAVGGLEQPLLAALLAWALVLARPAEAGARSRPFAAGVLLALACWTRPDGPLFAVGAAAGLILAGDARGRRWGTLAALLLPSAAAVLAQLVFRLAYYGDWVPNPAHAKLAFSPERALAGLGYVAWGLLFLGGLVLPALVLGVAAARRDALARRRIVFFAVPCALWLGYVVAIGGDIFPARRHLVPAIVGLALVAAEGARALSAADGLRPARARAVLVLLALLLALGQTVDPENRRARAERWEWDGRVVGRLLAAAFGERQPLLAVDPAGCLPYFSGLPAIDMLGLNDRHIAQHPPADLGTGLPGHELGDGRYVLDCEPDLILFTKPTGSRQPTFKSAREIAADPRFAERYRLAVLYGADPRPSTTRIWIRAEGGRLGITRDVDVVRVPGYFLTEGRGVAELDVAGVLGATVTTERQALIGNLWLPDGAWRLELEGEVEGARVGALRVGEPVQLGAEGEGEARVLHLAEGGPVSISVRTDSARLHVHALVLRRLR